MRGDHRGAAGFFDRTGLILYPTDRLYEEMAFLGYYMHWSHEELMNLDHKERRRWCKEVSKINKKISGTPENVFDRV